MKLPYGHLSPSQVEMFHRCGKQYEIFMVDGNRRPPDFFLISHGVTHEAILEHDLAYKKITGHNRGNVEISEFYRSKMEGKLSEIKEDPNLEGSAVKAVEEEVTYFDKIVAATEDFRKNTKPLEIEQKLQFNVGTVPVSVRLDLIEDETICTRISDLKRKGSGRGDPSKSLQLATYSIGTGIPDVGFRTIVENKSPKLERADGEVTGGTVERTVRQYETTADSIDKGIFMPVIIGKQTDWVCSAKFCGAWRKDATDWKTGRKIACPYGERSAISVAVKK